MNPAQPPAGVAGVFDRAAASYDQVGVAWFTPIARRLVERMAPQPGERALDVGCGRGAATFALAEAVGPAGHVSALDVAPGMVRLTAAEAADRGLLNVDVQVMDAMVPALPSAAYDLVVTSLVLFFLPDPAAALVAWLERLVPGGRLGVSTFGARDPRWEHVDAVFDPYLPPQLLDARTSGARGPFASDAGVEELVQQGGYEDVRTVRFSTEVSFEDAAHWIRFSWSHGQRGMWECVPQDEREAVRAQLTDRMQQCRDEDGRLRTSQDVRLTLATRPR